MSLISNKATIGNNVKFGEHVIIGDNVTISDQVSIGHNTILHNCFIGEGTIIEGNCNIGYSNITGWVSREATTEELETDILRIGKNVLIKEGTTIYRGAILGDHVIVHHKAFIREKSVIGEHTSIGSMADLEGNLTIGNYCSIHSNVHLCFDTHIGDYVFIAPFTVTTNGNPMGYKRPQLMEKFGREEGPHIGSGCQIAVHVTILPRVKIGYESMIGANTLVTKDCEPLSIIIGSPGVKKGTVDEFYRLPLEIREKLGLK